MASENALKEFKTVHAQGIAATKTEFVKFLREGELPDEELELIALYIYFCSHGALKPCRAGDYFATIVEDGIMEYIEYWDNPKKHAALMTCPMCDGEGDIPKAAANVKAKPIKTQNRRVRGVRGV